jgi:PKD repeat protein
MSTLQNPSYTYATTGTFTVTLVASSPGGSSTNVQPNLITVTNTNSVSPSPVASFTAAPTNGAAPLLVNFTDTSSGSPTSWNWSFGDTGTSASQSPSHSYTMSGTYTASLIVSNANGASTNFAAIVITVSSTNNITPPPVALFTAAPTNGAAPLMVNFTDASSGSPTSWNWSFGDTDTSTSQNPNHIYTTPGTYTVTLIASNAGGSSTNVQANLIAVTNTNILQTPPTLTIVSPSDYQTFTNAALIVSGTASTASGIKGVTVNNNAASVLGTNWFYNFNLALGTNVITVIATDNSPAMNTATQVVHAVLSHSLPQTNQAPVIVSAPAITNALFCQQNACVVVAGDTNVFSVGAVDPNGRPLNYAWTFGDGASTAPSPTNTATHIYTNCGPFSASVTVSDGIYFTNANLAVSVPCAMNINKLRLHAKFKKVGLDSCTIKGTLTGLPDGFSITNAAVSLEVGGAVLDNVQLDEKGSGANGNGSIKFSQNKKTGVWTFTSTLAGDLKGPWATYGITSGTVIDSAKPFPILLMLQSDTLETFDAEPALNYSNASGTSGTATLLAPAR